MSERATVFVVDDDKSSRESVQALVAPMDVEVELFSSAEAFLEVFDPSRPGCLVTDQRMLGMSGVELLEKLNDMGARIPTIVISAYADVPLTVRAMQQGAITLLEKPCRGMELWDVIRKALLTDEQTRALRSRRREVQQRLDALTDQEKEILGLVVAGVPNKAVAHQLDIGLRTVESRRKSIFHKMHANTIAELVQLVMFARDDDRGIP